MFYLLSKEILEVIIEIRRIYIFVVRVSIEFVSKLDCFSKTAQINYSTINVAVTRGSRTRHVFVQTPPTASLQMTHFLLRLSDYHKFTYSRITKIRRSNLISITLLGLDLNIIIHFNKVKSSDYE